MSGSKILADTNILSYILEGDAVVLDFLAGKDIYISIINKIELLTRKVFSREENKIVSFLLDNVTPVHTTDVIAKYAINFRKTYNIKLPDALIAATAYAMHIPLFTADKILYKIKEIEVVEFNRQ